MELRDVELPRMMSSGPRAIKISESYLDEVNAERAAYLEEYGL